MKTELLDELVGDILLGNVSVKNIDDETLLNLYKALYGFVKSVKRHDYDYAGHVVDWLYKEIALRRESKVKRTIV